MSIHSLEARYYTDPRLYDIEREAVMARTWQFAGHVSQLAKAGDYFSFTMADESLFCIRGQDDVIRTFYNVCQHRAHQLVQGSGNVRRIIACPYHGWTYTLTGELYGAPKIPNLGTAEVRLSEVKTEIFCGFIFVNLDNEASDMGNWFPNVEAELRAFVPNIDELKPLEWVEIPEHCNWKVSVENHSECYHCPSNHRAFTTGIIRADTYDIQPQGYCLRHTTKCQNLEKIAYPIDLNANAYAGEYSTWFLWPLFAFQVYPGNLLNTYHWQPQGVEQVTVWRGWYTPGGEESTIIRNLAVQDRATTVEEDIHLVEAVQRGLKSRGYRPGPLVLNPQSGINSEHSVQALQQWARESVDSHQS